MNDLARTFNFLVIDDSEAIRNQIRAILDQQAMIRSFHEAADGLQGFSMLTKESVDLIFCDLVMPRFDGFKFLTMKASRQDYQDVPVIILTSMEGISQKVKGLESGAADYITKPFASEELLARARVQLRLKTLQEELRGANQRLVILSTTDELTGLQNRRHLMEIINRELERARRYKRRLSFILMDLDHFKRVNDSYGHQAGDEVLQRIGKLIRTTIRATDIPARYGGEEIALVLPETDLPGAVLLTERVRNLISQLTFSHPGGTYAITASFGITTTSGNEKLEDVVKRSDDALYQAKELGRNRAEIAPEPEAGGEEAPG